MILVTNPGTLAAVDPFGSWGELTGGWSTWPLSPPCALLSVWRLHVYPGLGVERHLNSMGLHTMGTKRLLLVQLIKSTMVRELGSSVTFRGGQLVF